MGERGNGGRKREKRGQRRWKKVEEKRDGGVEGRERKGGGV